MFFERPRGRLWLMVALFLLVAGGSGYLVGSLITAPKNHSVGLKQVATLERPQAAAAAVAAPEVSQEQALDREWGIQASTIRLTAGGHALDFRYKILDVDRASRLSKPEFEAHVFQTAGDGGGAVNTKRAGPLLEGKQKLRPGDYRSIFFSNPGQSVKSGDLVTVVIGGYRAENLTVQ